MKLEKLLQEALQKGSWDGAGQRGPSGSLDIRHSLTWNGALKVHVLGWMVTVSKVSLGRGRERTNDKGSRIRGVDKRSSNWRSSSGIKGKDWCGCQSTLGWVCNPETFMKESSYSCSPHRAFWVWWCQFAKEYEHKQISQRNSPLVYEEANLKTLAF